MAGALISGSFIKYGKRMGLIVLNVILLISISICLSGTHIVVITIARFFWGFSAGSFSVYCPKFLAEYIPIELRGVFGGINQFTICAGIATPAVMSIALRTDPVKSL